MTLYVVIAGEVDHGKSTILGRLLHDTGSLADGKIEELNSICAARGVETEWSFLLDSFQDERNENITIDTTQVRVKTLKRDYVMIDAPGHREFIRNMISGATQGEAALLVVDAAEGVQDQTRRHAQILSLVGIEQIAVLVNKMDVVDYNQKIFKKIAKEISDFLNPSVIVPLAARQGDMIATRGDRMDWYNGPTLVKVLDDFKYPEETEGPLRFSVQDVYRMQGKRVIVGRVDSGSLKVGDEILFSPYNQRACVESMEVWPENPQKIEAFAGECIGITLDQAVFAERGALGVTGDNPPFLSPVFKARLALLSDKISLTGENYIVRIGTFETPARLQSLDKTQGILIEVTMRARHALAFDPGMKIVLQDKDGIVAAGVMIADTPKSTNIRREKHLVNRAERAMLNGHLGGVFWFTGLSGSGKSTLAMEVERTLFERGLRTYVLDGDNLRHGLSTDLGFSRQDRVENIRRVGEAASLMADAGLIVITAFISPYKTGREQARAATGRGFYEIHIKADLATCEARDPKSLYKKARAGEITGFTGIDSPYETPENPDLVIDTQNHNVEECVRLVLDFIEKRTRLHEASREEKIFAVQ